MSRESLGIFGNTIQFQIINTCNKYLSSQQSCEPSLQSFSFNVFVFVFFIFQADTRLFLFNSIFKDSILHIFLIIIIILRYSGMFHKMFHVPGFIDALVCAAIMKSCQTCHRAVSPSITPYCCLCILFSYLLPDCITFYSYSSLNNAYSDIKYSNCYTVKLYHEREKKCFFE